MTNQTLALPSGTEPVPEIAIHRRPLPEIVDASKFLKVDLPIPPLLIESLLHQGSKLILGGGSKTQKTWTLADMGISVATGEPFLGFPTIQGKVLFLNLEIQAPFFQQRLRSIIGARNLEIETGQLELWNLRGYAADYRTLLPRILERIKDAGHRLLIIDPIYKLLGGADENSATDMGELMNGIDELCVSTGAAAALAAHFSKGNQASKESIDRISGSGVFARDPDSLITFTSHAQEGAFSVEAKLRNLPPLEPFAVRWDYPRFTRDETLDPAQLKQAGPRGAAAKTVPTAEEYLGLFPAVWPEDNPRDALRSDGEIRESFRLKNWDRNSVISSRENAIRAGDLLTHQEGRNKPLLIGRKSVMEAFKAKLAEPVQGEMLPKPPRNKRHKSSK